MKVFLFCPCRLGSILRARVGVHNIETTPAWVPSDLCGGVSHICVYPSLLLPCFLARYFIPALPGAGNPWCSLTGSLLWRECSCSPSRFPRASLVAQWIKSLPAVRKNRLPSLGREDPLEKEMATHSSSLAWENPHTEEPGGLQSMGSQRVGHNWGTNTNRP